MAVFIVLDDCGVILFIVDLCNSTGKYIALLSYISHWNLFSGV